MKTTEHFKKLIEIFKDSDSKFEGVLNATRYDAIETLRRINEFADTELSVKKFILAPLYAGYLLETVLIASTINVIQPYGPDFIRGPRGWRPKDPEEYYWDDHSEQYVHIN